ncbi:MAG: hypothetical protein SFV15_01425 [Polyangiaceae bacterium]|nr:hypothetical protein [Polyangiaceae bacterium]
MKKTLVRDPGARFGDLIAILCVTLVHRVLGQKFLWAPFSFDEHYFLHPGWSMTKGLVPYRDFQDFKPPMIFVVNWLGVELFGLDGSGYRQLLSLLSLGAFLWVTIALLSRGTNRWFTVSVVALLIHHFFDGGFHDSSINNSESVGLNFMIMGVGVLLTHTNWVRSQLFLGGCLLALAPMSKEPFALPVVAAWVTLLCMQWWGSARVGAVKRFVIYTTGGVVFVASVWLGYMLLTQSFGWYIVQFKLNLAYAGNYAYQMGWFPRNPARGVWGECWHRLREAYINSAHLAIFVPFFAALVALWWKCRPLVVAGTVLTLASAVYAVTIGRAFAPHYYIMAMSGVFIYVIVSVIAIDEQLRTINGKIYHWVSLSWVVTVLVAVGPRLSDEWEAYSTYKPPQPPVSQADIALVRAYSSPGDRIWTLGDPLLYVYSDRLNAVREGIVIDEIISYHPGQTDEERLAGQRAELLANRPKLVIFGEDPVSYTRKERYIRSLVRPFLKEAGYKQISDKLFVRP